MKHDTNIQHTNMRLSIPVSKNQQLCCRKEAAQCFMSVSSQLQQYKTLSRSFYCQLCTLQIYHCMQLNALFCCLWRNVEASCHKHFVIFSRNQHRRILPAMCYTLLAVRWPWSTGDSVDNTCYVNNIAVFFFSYACHEP